MNGRKGCPDLDPNWPDAGGEPRGPVLCTSYPHCGCGRADRKALTAAHPAFVAICDAVLGELVASTFDAFYCSGAHSGIELVLEFGPDRATLRTARRLADEKARKQAREEPWFPDGQRFHRGRLAAIDLVLQRLPPSATPNASPAPDSDAK